MKNKIFIVIALLLAVGVTSGVGQTTKPAKLTKEERQAQRVSREALSVAQVTRAIENASFSFSADYMSTGHAQRVPVRSGNRMIEVMPDLLTVRLPYFSTSRSVVSTPMQIDFQTSDFEYSFQERKGVFYVTLNVRSITNNQSSRKAQSGAYEFRFTISPASSTATLVAAPNFTAPMTYTGTFLANE